MEDIGGLRGWSQVSVSKEGLWVGLKGSQAQRRSQRWREAPQRLGWREAQKRGKTEVREDSPEESRGLIGSHSGEELEAGITQKIFAGVVLWKVDLDIGPKPIHGWGWEGRRKVPERFKRDLVGRSTSFFHFQGIWCKVWERIPPSCLGWDWMESQRWGWV